jgi:yecA family protein
MAPIPKQLTPEQRRELTTFLDERAAPRGGMSIEYFDGFLSALLCTPDPPHPDDWLGFVLGEDDDDPPFDDAEHAHRMIALLCGHWNELMVGIREGGAYRPLTRESPFPEEGPPGRAWARAFLVGIQMTEGKLWNRLMRDRLFEQAVTPILALALEEDGSGFSALRIGREQRSVMLDALPMVVKAVWFAMASEAAVKAAKVKASAAADSTAPWGPSSLPARLPMTDAPLSGVASCRPRGRGEGAGGATARSGPSSRSARRCARRAGG